MPLKLKGVEVATGVLRGVFDTVNENDSRVGKGTVDLPPLISAFLLSTARRPPGLKLGE